MLVFYGFSAYPMRQIGRFVHVSKFDIDKILKTEK